MGPNLATNDIDYLLSISMSMYPKVSKELNRMLFGEYKKGVEGSLDNLIFSNFRFIVSIAKKYIKRDRSLELSELVNEGILGFIKALEKYDEGKGELLTYASKWIDYSIKTAININLETLKVDAKFQIKLNKYRELIRECQNSNMPLPSDEEIKIFLKVGDKTLEEIKKMANLQKLSLDYNMNEENPDETLKDCIADSDEGYERIEDEMSDKSLLIFLKEKLTPCEYFVLYSRILTSKKMTLSEIASQLGVTDRRINQIEKDTLAKVKQRYLKNGKINSTSDYSTNEMAKYNTLPIDIDSIMRYLYLAKILSDKERSLYSYYIKRKYDYKANYYAGILGVTEDEIYSIADKIKKEVSLIDNAAFLDFRKVIITDFGTRIFNLDLSDLNQIFEKYGSFMKHRMITDDMISSNILEPSTSLWDRITDDEAYEKIKNLYDVDSSIDDLLRRYFNQNMNDCASARVCQNEVNKAMFIGNGKERVPFDKLFIVLFKNKKEFTNEQYDFLLIQFGKISAGKFREKYPASSLLDDSTKQNCILDKLEELYFGIRDYGQIRLTKKQYMSIRDKMNEEDKDILDMIYGFDKKPLSIEEIVALIGGTYEEAYTKLYNAKRKAENKYLAKSKSKEIDESLYIPFIDDLSIDLNSNTRCMLRMFLVEHKNYEEIATYFKKSKQKISDCIMDGLRKIDFYRFGILLPKEKYTREELLEALMAPNIKDFERDIIKEYLKNGSIVDVGKKFMVDKKTVETILKRFYLNASNNKLANVEVSIADIENEIKCHPSVRVISEDNAKIMALYLGIKCVLNPEGRVYTVAEIKKFYPKAERMDKIKQNVKKAIAEKKLGLIRGQYAFMDRCELIEVLKDQRLPIRDKDRETIMYAFGIAPYEYKSSQELMDMYKEDTSTLRTRIQRAFLSIFKYINGEIKGTIDFTRDILPYFKYFSKADRSFLLDYYKNHLTYEELASRYKISTDAVANLIAKLTLYLDTINEENNGQEHFFDFDYYYEAIEKDDFPFYGDISKCKLIFRMFYDERLTAKQIIERVGLTCSESTIYRILSALKVASMKRKMGIVKVREYDDEEIRDYYIKNRYNMDISHQYVYFRYFDRKKRESKSGFVSASTVPQLSPIIRCDLLKANNEVVFDIETATKDEILSIIDKYKNSLSDKSLTTLLRIADSSERELLEEDERQKVKSILALVEKEVFQKRRVMVA